jgi:cell wall-associated NlpC family hydrolase
MGIDCSGFTQTIFKLFNYRLSRDAARQALEGSSVDFLQEARCGDLAFFDNEEGEITHVGILLDNHTIIHATESSGRVVIDAIDNNGIISKQLRMRTHHLRLVRRYFPEQG